MIQALILRKIDSLERELGASMDYVRHILRTSLRAFFRFVKIQPISDYRHALGPQVRTVGRLVAVLHEDCGSCVQIEVNAALADGVSPDILEAVLAGRPDELREELALTYRFVDALVQQTPEEAEHREALRARVGEEAFVELALALGTARFFPTVKRALGYGESCSAVPPRVSAQAQ